MLDLGFGEILVIVVLAIVVVGPDKLPETLRFLGRQYGKLMKASNELRRAFMAEADRAEAEERARDLKKKREEARARATEARARAAQELADKRALMATESLGEAAPGPAAAAEPVAATEPASPAGIEPAAEPARPPIPTPEGSQA
jgi:sec-independent protein translocase protein TatB